MARQQIRTWLENVDAGNRQQTLDKISGLLTWYRDLTDEELIAAWKKDARSNLPEVLEALATPRVASGVVEFSWREQRQTAFNLAYAPMLGHLMARFPESAEPFLSDLLAPMTSGRPAPDLADEQAKTVCRILVDMPDIGTWKKSAHQIVPLYRRAAESLLVQDLRGSDQEKSYQARVWLAELKSDAPSAAGQPASPRGRPPPYQPPIIRRAPSAQSVPPPADSGPSPAPAATNSQTARSRAPSAPAPAAPAASNSLPPKAPLPAAPAPAGSAYTGPQSGTLESVGGPIPQNAEYVFRNLPPVKMQLDYDTKNWEARLSPAEGQTQRLILKNKSSSPQKRCVVHWSVIR